MWGCTGHSNQPTASSGPSPVKHLSTGPLNDSSGIICLLIFKCTLEHCTGWSIKLLQDSDPTLAAWGNLKRKDTMLFHSAHSARADFLFPQEQRARGNYCPTSVWPVTLHPKEQWKAPVLIPALCSFPTTALSVPGNTACSATAALNRTWGNLSTGLFLSFQPLLFFFPTLWRVRHHKDAF